MALIVLAVGEEVSSRNQAVESASGLQHRMVSVTVTYYLPGAALAYDRMSQPERKIALHDRCLVVEFDVPKVSVILATGVACGLFWPFHRQPRPDRIVAKLDSDVLPAVATATSPIRQCRASIVNGPMYPMRFFDVPVLDTASYPDMGRCLDIIVSLSAARRDSTR